MEKVQFTEEQSTMLATLYGRALDARSAEPILGDPTAQEAVARIDYDFGKFGMGPDQALAIALRARVFDRWTRDFIDLHPEGMVVHLGCGMDGRVYRVDPPSSVLWFDVDYPETIDVRKRLYPERASYQQLGSSVLDLNWLDYLPADRPTLVLGEGLTMYLDPVGAPALLSALVRYLPSGEMAFDFYSRSGLKAQKLNSIIRRAGATLTWGIDDASELEPLGLKPAERFGVLDFITPEVLERASRGIRAQMWLARRIPYVANMGQLLRFTF
ncbi:class I SAM-dependent methyltransferase [Kribbella deserti]|uniref:Class I SAM-dependent methyltransferase n=1 Tax=Kribbella deserti TaxID=1926257 RepID=A0ABV6QLJ6_9ACTN